MNSFSLMALGAIWLCTAGCFSDGDGTSLAHHATSQPASAPATLASGRPTSQPIANIRGNAVSHPALRDELLARLRKDQETRMAARPDIKAMGAIDAANTAWMKRVVDEHGWPGKSMVGKDGAIAAFMLVQHAAGDPKFQERCLALMREAYEKKEVRGQDVAYLTDRVLVMQNKKQLYGTQFSEKSGKSVPFPIEDEKKLDARRAAMGLGPFAEYKRMMQGGAKGG